ncbi:MAG: hypothetical protein ACFFCP_00420 [Promethearchaeota archaeon]
MAKVKLKQFACPACRDGTLVYVEVDEYMITTAKRYPVMVTAKCPTKNHSLVVFVDANFQIRDVEAAAEATEEKKDAIDRTKGWFDSL